MSLEYCYLDYAASAPERSCSLEAGEAYDKSVYAGANPNSLHTLGRMSAQALEHAREDIARTLPHVSPHQLFFTSGGTESNNMSVLGLARAVRARKSGATKVILSAIEHDSILDLAPRLREEGFDVQLLRPNRSGVITQDALGALIDSKTCLVSIMYANNETGIIQPIPELAHCAHQSGACFHSDCVQAYGRIPLDLREVDAISIAAHKIGGPVGIGACVLKQPKLFRPLMQGGGQEMGVRPGTQSVRLSMQFAAAAAVCAVALDENLACVRARASALQQRLCACEGVQPTSDIPFDARRLPGIVSILARGRDAQSLLLQLDAKGFCISSGSACTVSDPHASHVLTAQGIEGQDALSSLRISFDERVSEDALQRFSSAFSEVLSNKATTF